MPKYSFFKLACATALAGTFAGAPRALAAEDAAPPADVSHFALSDDEIDQRCEHAENKDHCRERYGNIRDRAQRYLDAQNHARNALQDFREHNHCFGREHDRQETGGTGGTGDRCRDAHHQLSDLAHHHHQRLAQAAREASGLADDDDVKAATESKRGGVSALSVGGHHSSSGSSRPGSYGHSSGNHWGNSGTSHSHDSGGYHGGGHGHGYGHDYGYGHGGHSYEIEADDFESEFSDSMRQHNHMHVQMASYDDDDYDHDYGSHGSGYETSSYNRTGSSNRGGGRNRGSSGRDEGRDGAGDRHDGDRVAGSDNGVGRLTSPAGAPETSQFPTRSAGGITLGATGAPTAAGAAKPGTTTGNGDEYAPQKRNGDGAYLISEGGTYQAAQGGRSPASSPSYYGNLGASAGNVPEFAVSSGSGAEASASGAAERATEAPGQAVSQAGAGTGGWSDAVGNAQSRADFVSRLSSNDELRRTMARRIAEASAQGEVDAGTAQAVRGAIAEAQRRSQERRELANLKPEAFKMDAEGTANEISRLMAKLADEPREEFLASPDEPLFRRVKGTIQRELERGHVKRPKLLN